jgi:peptidoglycan hydrolase-like protein with peptidoglycan-binding domain
MSNLLKSKFFLGMMVVAFALVASTASAAYMHSGLLKMGMTSSNVMSLQQTLNGGGFLVSTVGAGSPGMESMYFGAKTKAAVMAFQSAKGLTADGVVGVQTGTALASMTGGSVSYPAGCTSTTGFSTTTGMSCASTGSTSLPAGCMSTSGFSPTTGMSCSGGSTPSTSGPLTGGAGSITIDDSSEYASEEVGEAEDDVEVLQFSVEADDESDVAITSVKVEFVQGTAADSEDIADYAESVSVWLNGKMVGSADTDSFSESSDVYTKSISLDNAIVRAGDEENFVVAVTALNNLDSGDIDTDAWTVDVLNVRFEDADGVVTTEDTDADGLEQTFDFTDFATAADLALKISLGDEDVNDARAINIDDTDTTDNVDLLSFEMEAEGSDVMVDSLPVTITTVEATGNDPDDLIATLYLYADGVKIGTETLSTGDADDSSEVVVFSDLGYTIDANDTIEFIVKAKIKATNTGLDDGDTIQVTFGETQTDLATFDAEDEKGEELADADVTGTAVGDAHGVFDVGINAKFVSSSAVATPSGVATVDDTGTFKIVFDVTAFDSDIYVDGTVIADETGGATYQDIDATTTSVGAGVIECSGCTTAANTTFKVSEGQTERFTVTIAGSGADVFSAASLTSILYALTPIDGDLLYTFNMTDFKTDSVWLDSN